MSAKEQKDIALVLGSGGARGLAHIGVIHWLEEHDYNIKCARAEKFLDEGHKVRVQLQFRGRENAHRDIGFEVMNKVKEDLKGMAHVDMEPKLAGRAIGMILSPLPEEKRERHFMLSHGELIHEDEAKDAEFDDDDEHDDEGEE